MSGEMIDKYFEFKREDISEGKYDSWDLVQPLCYSVSLYDNGYDKYELDLKPFSQAQRRFLALSWYEIEVQNGGHYQFLINSTGMVWKDVIEGLEMIGAQKHADNFRKVIDVFGGTIPFGRDEREGFLDAIEDEDFDGFWSLDSFYYKQDNLIQIMDEYAKNNPDEFVVNGVFEYFEL